MLDHCPGRRAEAHLGTPGAMHKGATGTPEALEREGSPQF